MQAQQHFAATPGRRNRHANHLPGVLADKRRTAQAAGIKHLVHHHPHRRRIDREHCARQNGALDRSSSVYNTTRSPACGRPRGSGSRISAGSIVCIGRDIEQHVIDRHIFTRARLARFATQACQIRSPVGSVRATPTRYFSTAVAPPNDRLCAVVTPTTCPSGNRNKKPRPTGLIDPPSYRVHSTNPPGEFGSGPRGAVNDRRGRHLRR